MSTSAVDSVPEVVVYSSLGCKYCSIAKQTLRQQGVPFREISVGDAADARKEMSAKAGGATSVPQIFVGPEHVGGCEQLLAELPSGRFAERLSSAGIQLQAPILESTGSSADSGQDVVEVRPLNGILNYHPPPSFTSSDPTGAGAVASSLQERVLKLFDSFVRVVPGVDGGPGRQGVDFEAMKRSREFAEYVVETGRLRPASIRAEIAKMHGTAKMALFINLYNSLLLHGSVAVPPGPSDPDARGPFFSGESGVRYDIGGFELSLDDIEHGILRSSPEGDKRSFPDDDSRRAYVVEKALFDPRIHFALNCGARSCPPIKLYSADNLQQGLQAAAQAFCESEVQVNASSRTITLSRIFLWYGKDFAPTTWTLLEKLAGYAGEGSATREGLESVLAEGSEGWGEEGGGGWKVEFAPYDWSQNSI